MFYGPLLFIIKWIIYITLERHDRVPAMAARVGMLELLAPAGSMDAVMAAVQSGADTIYIGEGLTAPGKGERDMDRDALSECLRYCRIRGCRAAVSLCALYTDESLPKALELAVFAAREGANALVVRDVGFIDLLRRVLPDMPLWGDVRLGVDSLAGAAAAAAMGLSRVLLSPELSLEQIAAIAKGSPIQTGVVVHGPVCVAHSGQCYMGALAHEHKSDNAMLCTRPCRGRFSLGGRMDETPLAMADQCLVDHMEALETIGLACAVIEGRGRSPEYVAYATRIYARAIREKLTPSEDERGYLQNAFGATGLSDGYLNGEPGQEMFAQPAPADRISGRFYSEIRKSYRGSELRRVPVKLYAVMRAGQPALFAAEDEQGHRAVYKGFEPLKLDRLGVSDARVREILYRTGGTPFSCTEVNCAVEPGLDYPDEAVEDARKALLKQIGAQRRERAEVTVGEMPPRPEGLDTAGAPKLILQVTRPEQLTAELAATGPDLVYVPAELLAAGSADISPFLERGAEIAAALPWVVSEAEQPVLLELLEALKGRGVTQALIGNLGLLPAVRQAGLTMRGDLGLNAANSWTLKFLGRGGFASVAASGELTARQVGELAKSVPTEMVVYGRLPVMITHHCIIRNSAGRCSCVTPTSMGDAFGSVYPVVKEFGCRNLVFDARKTFLADHPEVYSGAGLWGLRLLFTTESPRECVNVTERYKAKNNYLPTNASRGAYQKGALWS